MVNEYIEELDVNNCTPFDEFNPRIEYDKFMYNKNDLSVSITKIECIYGNFNITFSNSWPGPNKHMINHETTVCPIALERFSLKDLYYFLEQFMDEHCYSIGDYDDDEILDMVNNKIRKLIMLYSSGITMPVIKLTSPIIKYDEIEIYDKCTNIEELIEWKYKATRKCMELV